MSTPNAQNTTAVMEPVFTVYELAEARKLHISTIRKLFIDEPGTIRVSNSGSGRRRQRLFLRIPASVAERVFARMTVGTGRLRELSTLGLLVLALSLGTGTGILLPRPR
jgi:hypothetical protein